MKEAKGWANHQIKEIVILQLRQMLTLPDEKRMIQILNSLNIYIQLNKNSVHLFINCYREN